MVEEAGQNIRSLAHNDSKLGQLAADEVAHLHTLVHEQLPGPMQHQDSVLIYRFDSDKVHGRALHSLADRSASRASFLAAADAVEGDV